MTPSPIPERVETTMSPPSVTTASKGKKLFAWLTVFILITLPVISFGAILVSPFIPQAIFLGLGALASFLVATVALSIVVSYLSSLPSTPVIKTTRPRDLDLSQLDARHNRLLHDLIQEDEKKYQQEKKEASVPRSRRKSVPSQDVSQETSSSSSSSPVRKKRTSVLKFLRPKQLSSSSSSSDSDFLEETSIPRSSTIQNQPWLTSLRMNKNS